MNRSVRIGSAKQGVLLAIILACAACHSGKYTPPTPEAMASGSDSVGRLRIDPDPRLVQPRDLHWIPAPGMEGVRMAWAIGSEQAKGAYALRVRIEPNGRIPVHRHPDARVVTVLSGSLTAVLKARILRGEQSTGKFAGIVHEASAGSVYLVPAEVPHDIAAGPEGVEYQETGFGPTGTTLDER